MEQMSKKKITDELESYLKLIQNRITTEASNHFTPDELDSLDDIGKLSKYIKPSNYLSEQRKRKKRQIDSIKNISKVNGTAIV